MLPVIRISSVQHVWDEGVVKVDVTGVLEVAARLGHDDRELVARALKAVARLVEVANTEGKGIPQLLARVAGLHHGDGRTVYVRRDDNLVQVGLLH